MSQIPLTVAYFTMEIGLRSDMPTYAGGLGMLAADIMRSAADLGTKAACMTVCWQHGYMRQVIQKDGNQQYEDVTWDPAKILTKLDPVVEVKIEGRTVNIGVWKFDLQGRGGIVPVYFLDTNIDGNSDDDKNITNHLYGGDHAMRLRQEIVLGIGGVKMLRALGHTDIGTFHMNEGHAAFLTLELLREHGFNDDAVRKHCAFTTHTPIPAGHDIFDYDLAWRIAGDQLPWHIKDLAGQDALSTTVLAMTLSRYTCGVSRVHGQVTRGMFPGREIDFITNGIHAEHWACAEMQALFDRHIPGWREDPMLFTTRAGQLPDADLWQAHMSAKKRLIDVVNAHTDDPFDIGTLTIASARRVVSYKRPELLYTNLERLAEVCHGRVQIIHAGNAHPSDSFGQDTIKRMIERSKTLRDKVKIVYLENYSPDLAQVLVSGADVWLNTPTRLHEASGTSGMKASVNGGLNLSTLDGWWIEGYERDAQSGWRIGPLASALDADDTRKVDAEDLYTQLQYQVLPDYYERDHTRWMSRMKRSVALIGFFNTHRCVHEYIEKAWR